MGEAVAVAVAVAAVGDESSLQQYFSLEEEEGLLSELTLSSRQK